MKAPLAASMPVRPSAADTPRVFRKFVHNVLGSVERRETTAAQAGDLIAQEFEAKLNEKVETLELRVKQLERQEQMLQGRFETLQGQRKAALEGGNAPSAA